VFEIASISAWKEFKHILRTIIAHVVQQARLRRKVNGAEGRRAFRRDRAHWKAVKATFQAFCKWRDDELALVQSAAHTVQSGTAAWHLWVRTTNHIIDLWAQGEYMSPEQAGCGEADSESESWSDGGADIAVHGQKVHLLATKPSSVIDRLILKPYKKRETGHKGVLVDDDRDVQLAQFEPRWAATRITTGDRKGALKLKAASKGSSGSSSDSAKLAARDKKIENHKNTIAKLEAALAKKKKVAPSQPSQPSSRTKTKKEEPKLPELQCYRCGGFGHYRGDCVRAANEFYPDGSRGKTDVTAAKAAHMGPPAGWVDPHA
jgi:hypothetical protein